MRMPMNGGSSKKVVKKVAAPKPSVRQIETSNSAKYRGTTKVSQTTIDNIKKLGMDAALKKAATSKNVEYLEGIKRMYGAKRLSSAQGAATAKKAASGLSGLQKKAIKRGM